MELSQWMSIYNRICLDMGHNPGDDMKGAATLSALLVPERQVQGLSLLKSILAGREAIAIGPKLVSEEVQAIKACEAPVLIVADSALPIALDAGLVPDIIVSDLDGDKELLISNNKEGVLLLAHAHGDNIPLIMDIVPQLDGPVVGTCQVVPPPPISNFGGYTDGDRAVLVAVSHGAKSVYIAGFDFEDPVAKPGQEERKRKKLRWAREIIDTERSRGAHIRNLL